jgi:hypothetical protein
MSSSDAPDASGRLGAQPYQPAGPHAKRIQELFIQRLGMMSSWGVRYHTLGPEHPETTKALREIDELGIRIMRLGQEDRR